MIRTLLTLRPGQTRDGARVLRGELGRDLITTDADGNERTYPAGTQIVLRRGKGDVYSLLAILDDPPEPARKSNTRAAIASRQLRAMEPERMVPF